MVPQTKVDKFTFFSIACIFTSVLMLMGENQKLLFATNMTEHDVLFAEKTLWILLFSNCVEDV